MNNDPEMRKRKAEEALALAVQMALEVGLLRSTGRGLLFVDRGQQAADQIGSRIACIDLDVAVVSRCLTCRPATRSFGLIRESGAGRRVRRRRPSEVPREASRTDLEVA